MSDVPVEAAAEPAKGGGMLKKLLMIGVVLIVAWGGAAYFLMGSGGESAEAKEVPLEARGLVTFEPFLVNLADAGGNRFLKATIQLVMESAAEAAHVQETPVVASHLRSSILELLTQQQAPALVTAEGKEALKAAIKKRLAEHLKEFKVIDVLFSEFVVQF